MTPFLNPFLFFIGCAFVVAGAFSFYKGDPRYGCMCLGLAFANCALGW